MNFACTENNVYFEISELGENLSENYYRPNEAVEKRTDIDTHETHSYGNTILNQRQSLHVVKR